MGNSFRDQFLKAGLVSKKQAKKAKRQEHIGRKKNKKGNHSEISDKARDARESQAERERQLNLQLVEKNRQRECKAQIRQLVEENRLDRDGRGEPYNFVERKKVKRIFVSAEMAESLSRGQLGIVRFGDGYELVPAKVARQIASRDSEALIVLHR